jgi:light-regulated signal transduction histidine kinase (bacteriophytochrome)
MFQEKQNSKAPFYNQSDVDNFYREIIHEIGAIQDQGYVLALVVDSVQIRISSMSENLTKVTWMKESDPSKIISKDIFEIFDNDIAISITNQIHKFQSMALDSIALGTSSAKNYMLLRMKSCWEGKTETLLCCSVTGCSNPSDTYILEMETISDPSFALPNNHILQSGDIVGRIRAGASPEAVSAAFCDAAMEILSDYDRGMVYRFAEDCTGEVIHEKIRSEAVWTAGSGLQSSYLNMRFPAEDIPKQARALYLKNGLRFIFDVIGVDSSS